MRPFALCTLFGLLLLCPAQPVRAEQPDSIGALSGVSALGAVACWTASLAEAGEEEDDEDRSRELTRRGILVGAGLSYAHELFESDISPAGTKASVKDSLGLRAKAGYRCHRYASVDVQLEWLDNFEGKLFEDGAGETVSFDVRPLVVTTNLRGYVPLFGDRLQPFFLVGAGFMSAEIKARETMPGGSSSKDEDTEFAYRLGGGIDFYLTHAVVITLEGDYVAAVEELDDLDWVSVGLGVQYRF